MIHNISCLNVILPASYMRWKFTCHIIAHKGPSVAAASVYNNEDFCGRTLSYFFFKYLLQALYIYFDVDRLFHWLVFWMIYKNDCHKEKAHLVILKQTERHAIESMIRVVNYNISLSFEN